MVIFMLFSYEFLKEKYDNYYQLNKRLIAGELHKIEAGIYSDIKSVPELEIISFKYPNAVFSSESAYFYHGLTHLMPGKYCLATAKDAYKIHDDRVRQFFFRDERFNLGITDMEYKNIQIKVYDLERMLIELIRNKHKMSFDRYKEIINSYRHRVYDLHLHKINEYLERYKNSDNIMNAIRLEVF